MTASSTSRVRPHFLWLGPVLAVPAFLSYWAFFAQWPIFRDTAWLNIVALLCTVVLSVLGLRSVWSRGAGMKVAGVASVFVPVALTCVLVAYCYGMSYDLPSADLVMSEGERLPAITLISDAGEAVDLAGGSGSVILVFYRGFW